MDELRRKLKEAEYQIEELQRNNKQLEHKLTTTEGGWFPHHELLK